MVNSSATGKTNKRSSGTPDPPLVTTQDALRGQQRHILAYSFVGPSDPQSAFEEFMALGSAELELNSIGNASQVSAVYMNADKAVEITRRSLDQFQQFCGMNANLRTQNAGWLIVAASQMVNAALLPFMKGKRFYGVPTLTLLRSALEGSATGGFIALGKADEATRWEKAATLPTPKERRQAEIKATEALDSVVNWIAKREPQASNPRSVYAWLCKFTHLSCVALANPPSREAAYAALAYVSWFCAAMAEIVTGVEMAEWPSVWPPKLPWTSSGGTTGARPAAPGED